MRCLRALTARNVALEAVALICVQSLIGFANQMGHPCEPALMLRCDVLNSQFEGEHN